MISEKTVSRHLTHYLLQLIKTVMQSAFPFMRLMERETQHLRWVSGRDI